jgi:hypothetical protein
MNLAPILDTFGSLAAAVIATCVPILTMKALSYLGLNTDVAQRDALNTTLTNALGKALQTGQQAGDSALANVTIKNAALASAVAYVNANAPAAVGYFGLSDSAIAEKVGAKLSLALHQTGTAPAPDPEKAAATAAMLEAIPAPAAPVSLPFSGR